MNSSVLRAVVDLYRDGGKGVLVTLCATEGATPGEAGASMLVYPSGEQVGTIGGGALEHEAVRRALEVIKTGKSYYLELPSLGDLGMNCGGGVVIFLEYLQG